MDLRGYTPEEFERQFNPRAAVPDHQPKIDARVAMSKAARTRLKGHYDIPYGPGAKELLDIFPAAASDAPVQLYVHGGYWRAQDKSDVTFLAEPLTAAGACTVIMNYDLCPDVTVPEIVVETVRAIAWVHAHIAQYGGDPQRIFISGNSAGAHLCAMALAHDWTAAGLPEDIVKGAALLTGVYDPEPVLGLSVNDQIRLTPEQVPLIDPRRHLPRRPLPLLIAVGGAETESWIKQSRDYHALCREHGIDAEYLEMPGEDHFTMTGVMGETDKPALQTIFRQMGLS